MRIGPGGKGMCDPCYHDFMNGKGRPVNQPVKQLSDSALQQLVGESTAGPVAPIRARKVQIENGHLVKCGCGRLANHKGRCFFRRKNRTGTARGASGLKDGPDEMREKASRVGHKGGGESGRGKPDTVEPKPTQREQGGNAGSLQILRDDLVRRRDELDKAIQAVDTVIELFSKGESE